MLAFDTSTDWLSVAALDGRAVHMHTERAAHANSERILPAIDAVLAEAGWRLADLDGIAFGAGPGTFTGVRIACGVAQGLSLGTDLPVVPVPTLMALAQDAWRERQAKRVFACLDARMREVYVAFHVREADAWREVGEARVLPPADVVPPAGEWQGAGDGFAAYAALGRLPSVTDVDELAFPTARGVGEIALPWLAQGRGVPADRVQPIYVRHRVALTTAERASGLAL